MIMRTAVYAAETLTLLAACIRTLLEETEKKIQNSVG